jgi:PKD repeat protein
VYDSEFPACGTATATIGAAGTNAPPNAVLSYRFTGGLSHEWVGSSIAFSASVSDAEGDPIAVTWDFGDGASATNQVTGTSTVQTVTQGHTYSAQGNYSLRVTVADGQPGPGHTKVLAATIPVWRSSVSAGGGGPAALNPWINYGVPIAVAAAIVVIAAALIWRRRKAARREREEGEAGQQPPPPPPAP